MEGGPPRLPSGNMAKTSFTDRLKHWLVEPHYPNIGIEFNSDCIRLAVVSSDNGTMRVQHLDAEVIPAGALEVSPFKPNIVSLEPVSDALRRLWARNRWKDSRICLLIQDRSALAFQVTLDQPPTNRQECSDLIRFKLKRNVPFRIEESQISYFAPSGIPDYSATSLWVTVIHHPVLHQYEQFVNSAIEAECGLVDFSTFNLMNLNHAELKNAVSREQDLLYVNLNRDYVSIAITQNDKLAFYRSRALEGQTAPQEEALSEIYPTTLFYADKLGGKGLNHAFIYAVEDSDLLAGKVEATLHLNSSVLSAGTSGSIAVDMANQKWAASFTPLLGLIVSRKLEYQ